MALPHTFEVLSDVNRRNILIMLKKGRYKMKNDKKEILIWMLILLLIIVPTMATVFLPNTVPVHYNIKGEIDSWGSKYTNFIILIVTGSLVVFLKIYSNRLKKTANSNEDYKSSVDAKRNVVVVDYVNIGVLILFNIMNIFIVYKQFYYTNNTLISMEFDMYEILTIICGIIATIICIYLLYVSYKKSFK